MNETGRGQPESVFEQENNSKDTIFHGANLVEFLHSDALHGESFENAAHALDEVTALQNFRKELRWKNFVSVYDIFEIITNIQKLSLSRSEKAEHIQTAVDVLQEKASKFSPRVADIYLALLAKIGGESFFPKFETTEKKMRELDETGDLEVLISPVITWDMKLNRIETRLAGFLAGARALDKRDGKQMDDDVRNGDGQKMNIELKKQRQEKLDHAPTTPPERRNSSKPSMDEMERLKEGERAPALWSIYPAYGGYFREQSFSKWDSQKNEWVEENYEYSDVEFVPKWEKENPKEGLINFTMRTQIQAGQWVSIPTPYTHGIHKIETTGQKFVVQQDQNGDVVIMVEGQRMVDVNVFLSPNPKKHYGPQNPKQIKTPQMPAQFSEESIQKLRDIQKSKKRNAARAGAIGSYVRSRIAYSNDSRYNKIYDSSEKGYFAAIDEHRKADCDVANTYWSALCAKLDIPTRHVVGHSVKGKDTHGASNITSGTGHGWGEVWNEKNNTWERVDATPPGDSNLEEESSEQDGSSSPVPGDYGSNEAVRPSDEKVDALRKKLVERKEKLSYTPRERELSRATGVELKEARQIVKEIIEADNICLPNGEKIVDVLGALFSNIIQERKNVTPVYEGPVRRSDGGETITHMVAHVLGVKSGDIDPESRERDFVEVVKEKVFGGLNVYLIGDKSGSTSQLVDGEPLWKMQRLAEYLIFSSLHRFENNIRRAHLPDENSLSVQTLGISFRDQEEIDEDKSLSPTFSDEERVKLWHGLTKRGGGNGDVAALSHVYAQIKDEITKEKSSKNKKEENSRIRLVIACSDGGYVDEDAVLMQQISQELFELGVVVVGMGLTKTAANVPVVMDTPYSKGDIAVDIHDLPALIAKHVVLEVIKLFPNKSSRGAQTAIETVIKKFQRLSK